MSLYRESWLANRLDLPLNWDAGLTTTEQRREAIRAAILSAGPETVIGKSAGSAVTYRLAFSRCYGQPLQEVL